MTIDYFTNTLTLVHWSTTLIHHDTGTRSKTWRDSSLKSTFYSTNVTPKFLWRIHFTRK